MIFLLKTRLSASFLFVFELVPRRFRSHRGDPSLNRARDVGHAAKEASFVLHEREESAEEKSRCCCLVCVVSGRAAVCSATDRPFAMT